MAARLEVGSLFSAPSPYSMIRAFIAHKLLYVP